jgi:hypothetical protein
MSETIIIHDQTWKISEIEKEVLWCKSQDWKFIEYPNSHDHEHCTICYWTIFQTEEADSGFAYQSSNQWLCVECYDGLVAK